jgi:copper chaperone CopZ
MRYALVASIALVLLCAAPVFGETVSQKFALSGVRCHDGKHAVTLAVDGVEGVKQARVLIPAKELQVTYDPSKTNTQAIIDAVRAAPAAGQSGDYDAVPK